MLWLAIRTVRQSVQDQQPVQMKQLELLDKMTTLVASGDVLSYQGIQAMQVTAAEYAEFDPSDEGQAARERELYGRDAADEGLTSDDFYALGN